MCQISKMSYGFGSLTVEVSSDKDLIGCVFELYVFNFQTGMYGKNPNIKQDITQMHVNPDSGVYTFKYSIPSNCKMKCVVRDKDGILVSKERYIGDKYKVKITSERTEIGVVFTVKSDISLSRTLIGYKSPASSVMICLPDNVNAGEPLSFVIKDSSYNPTFEIAKDYVECINIE